MQWVINLPNRFKILLFIAGFLILLGLSITAIYYSQQRSKQANLIKPEDKIVTPSPGAEYVPDELVVELQDIKKIEEKSFQQKLEERGVESWKRESLLEESPYFRYIRLKLKAGANLDQVKTEVAKLEEVTFVDVNYLLELFKDSNDPLFTSQDIGINQWGLKDIAIQEGWDLALGNTTIIVGVVDSGLDYNHPDILKANVILPSENDLAAKSLYASLDSDGHGTHVAGIIGATTNNAAGMAGVNWNVKIMPINVTDGKERFSILEVKSGVELAYEKGAKVINLSLGTDAVQKGCRDFDKPPASQKETGPFQELLNNLAAKGVVIVAAAGNEDIDVGKVLPASCDNVIAVGAYNAKFISEGTQDPKMKLYPRAFFSNFGNLVDIAAPGMQITSLKSTNCSFCNGPQTPGYMRLSGTSQSAPFVSGAVALLLSSKPQLTPNEILNCIQNSADEFDRQPDKPIGKKLNVYKMIKSCGNTTNPQPAPNPSPPTGGSQPVSNVEYPIGATISIPSCVSPSQKINISVTASAKDADNPLIAVNAHFRKQGLPDNGKDLTGRSWGDIFKDPSVGDKVKYEKVIEGWEVPSEEGDYDIVVNAFVHKSFTKGGGAYAEKACSGNPFSAERGAASMSDCGANSRKVLKVRRNPANCGDSTSASVGGSNEDTAVNPEVIDLSTQSRPGEVNCRFTSSGSDDGLQIKALECR